MAPVNNPYLRKAKPPPSNSSSGAQTKSVVGNAAEKKKSNNNNSQNNIADGKFVEGEMKIMSMKQQQPAILNPNNAAAAVATMSNNSKQPQVVVRPAEKSAIVVKPSSNKTAAVKPQQGQSTASVTMPRPTVPTNAVVAATATKQQQPCTGASSSSSFKSQLKQQIEALKRAKMLEKQKKQREKQQKSEVLKPDDSKIATSVANTATQQPTNSQETTTLMYPPMVPAHPMSFYGTVAGQPIMFHHHHAAAAMTYPTTTPAKQQQLGVSTTAALSHVTPSPLMMPYHTMPFSSNATITSNNNSSSPDANVKMTENQTVHEKQPGDDEQSMKVDAVSTTMATTSNPTVAELANPSAVVQGHVGPHLFPATTTSWYPPYPPGGAMLPYNNGGTVFPPPHVLAMQQPYYPGSIPPYNPAHALPSSNANTMYRGMPAAMAPPKPAPQPKKFAGPLSTDPMKAPSPFAETHEVLSEEFIIYKDKGGSFGLDVIQRVESVLVDREEEMASLNPQPTASAPQRNNKRRVRKFFSALMVGKADKQNARPEHVDSTKQLRRGDIILTIDDKSTAGLSFQEACSLFKSAGGEPSSDDGVVRCRVTIARHMFKVLYSLSPAPSASVPAVASAIQQNSRPMLPFVVNEITGQVVIGEFSASETVALAKMHLNCMSSSDRILGYPVNPSILLMERNKTPELACRDIEALIKKWNHSTLQIELTMRNRARVFCSQQWTNEKEKAGSIELPVGLTFISDAQRSVLRDLPRPSTGCKCGSSGHDYVNDPACPLYSNVRLLRSGPAVEEEPPKKKPALPKNLNAVETAYAERALKLKEEANRIAREARFVEEMEKLQVAKQKLAVFAPNFTTIVLSAVAEITKDLATEEVGEVPEVSPLASIGKDSPCPEASAVGSGGTEGDEDEDDDEDEITLAALGKRAADTSADIQVKRPKIETPDVSFSPIFLAGLLRYISLTWGHLCPEPSHDDHAWRWEVFHGQTGAGGKDGYAKNPREPGRLSFENIRHVVTDKVLASFRPEGPDAERIKAERAEALSLVAHLASPQSTGLVDELMALVRSKILSMTTTGYAVLKNRDWTNHVDPLLLDDMYSRWSKKQDPENKYCVSPKIRRALEETWMRVADGWAQSGDPDDIVYPDDEWEEWRRHFQEKHESRENEADGIHKFGI